MDINLTKWPWHAQVGAFVLLGLAVVGAFSTYYEAPIREDMARRQAQLVALRAEIDKGYATARRLPEFRRQVAELESRLDELNAVLPGEKDAADLRGSSRRRRSSRT
jgi:Tfp pilus assembly protein PilO